MQPNTRTPQRSVKSWKPVKNDSRQPCAMQRIANLLREAASENLENHTANITCAPHAFFTVPPNFFIGRVYPLFYLCNFGGLKLFMTYVFMCIFICLCICMSVYYGYLFRGVYIEKTAQSYHIRCSRVDKFQWFHSHA
jgi:hypothetical protein